MVSNRGTDRVFNIVIIVIMSLFSIITILPLLFVLANSFSSADAVNAGEVGLIPVDFTLAGYERVFSDSEIMRGYGNTLLYTAIGILIQLILIPSILTALKRSGLAE